MVQLWLKSRWMQHWTATSRTRGFTHHTRHNSNSSVSEAVEFRRGRKRRDSRSADILEINFEMEGVGIHDGRIEGVHGIPPFPGGPHEFVERKCRVFVSTPPSRCLDGVQKWFASNEATLFPRDVPFLPAARVNIARSRNLRRKGMLLAFHEFIFRRISLSNPVLLRSSDRVFVLFQRCDNSCNFYIFFPREMETRRCTELLIKFKAKIG